MTRRSSTALPPLLALCAALAVVLAHAAVALAQPAPTAPTPVRTRRDRLNPAALVRAVRANAALGCVPLLAISRIDAPATDALPSSIDVALDESDAAAWHAALAALD